MPLTSDQTAVLELLLAGQTYADLEELLGVSQDEVRLRARSALAELGGADPDRNVGLSDYLLGQADPIGRADAVRHLRQDASDHALATRISERLAEIAPSAELPKLPPAPGGGSFLGRGARVAEGEGPERRSPLAAIPQGRSRVYAALGAAAVVLLAVVLAVTGVFSGDDEGDADTGTTTSAEATEGSGNTSGIPDGDEITRVPLEPTGGGDAAGAAVVGLASGDQPYVDVAIKNLEQAPQRQAYVIWFMFDEDTGYPLSPIFPDQKGAFTDRFAIPAAVTGLIFNERLGAEAIEVALSDAEETLVEIQQAAQDETYQIERPGRTILQGKIPNLFAGAGDTQGQGGS